MGQWGRAYPEGFDILGYFDIKFFTQGEKTDVKYPFRWGTFVWFKMILEIRLLQFLTKPWWGKAIMNKLDMAKK